jgi:hypothetical protein
MAVHFVPETYDDRLVIGANGFGVCVQIVIVTSCGDRRHAGFCGVYLYEWHGAIASHSRGEACLKRLHPSAVINDNSWFDPGRFGERLNADK